MKPTVYALKAFRTELHGMIRDVRVTWLLEELGVAYERIVMDPTKQENRTEAYLKINPSGKVPAYVDEQITLFESGAIMEYLAEKHRRLIPEHGTQAYYFCRQWLQYLQTTLEPHVGRLFSCDKMLEPSETTAVIRQMAMDQLPRLLQTLDQALVNREWLVGDQMTIADMMLFCILRPVEYAGLIDAHPNVTRLYSQLRERPACSRAYAANGRV